LQIGGDDILVATLLTILKVIGWILLVLLAIVLLVVILVLFVPIKYKYRFRFDDESEKKNCNYADVSWIFKLLKCKVLISLKGIEYQIRICGIRCRFIEKRLNQSEESYEEFDDFLDEDENIMNNSYDDGSTKKEASINGDSLLYDDSYEKSILPNSDYYSNSEDDRTLIEKIIDGDLDEVIDGYGEEEMDADVHEDDLIKSTSQTEVDDHDVSEDDANATEFIENNDSDEKALEDEESAEELVDELEDIWNSVSEQEDVLKKKPWDNIIKAKTRLKNKILRFIRKIISVLNPINWLKIIADKIINFIKYIIEIIKAFINSVKSIIHKLSLILDFLDKPSTERGLEKGKEYLAKTFKHILPRKNRFIFNIGFDDPSTTGQVLAAAGIVYPLFGKSLEIYPNFSEKELKVECLLQGRIRGINVLIIVIKVIRDKAIKRLLYNLRKLKEEL